MKRSSFLKRLAAAIAAGPAALDHLEGRVRIPLNERKPEPPGPIGPSGSPGTFGITGPSGCTGPMESTIVFYEPIEIRHPR